MAMGFSGSNGGVQEESRKFDLTDVDEGISKSESLYNNIPKDQLEVRNFHQHVIDGLKELRQEMTRGSEGKFTREVGFSNSNGSIDGESSLLNGDLLKKPLEVSYFINNRCNLRCKHCYVGYEERKGELSISEWTDVFDELIDRGALTFGNVGKEPLLSPEKTLSLLTYFAKKREENSKLRFGFVTHGTLLEGKVVDEITEVSPDYIDVSLDGTVGDHDYIRGRGNYSRTINNLRELSPDFKQKVFISYTLMKHNKDSFKDLINEMSEIGLKKFLVSPYVSTPYSNEELALTDEDVTLFFQRVIQGQEVDFSKLDGVEILLKSDFDTQKPLIDRLIEKGVIDVNSLLIDGYGVLFNRYLQQNDSGVIVNYMPFSDTLSRQFRISHDGHVSGCFDMFHKDYPKRAKGNLRNKRIEEIILNV